MLALKIVSNNKSLGGIRNDKIAAGSLELAREQKVRIRNNEGVTVVAKPEGPMINMRAGKPARVLQMTSPPKWLNYAK